MSDVTGHLNVTGLACSGMATLGEAGVCRRRKSRGLERSTGVFRASLAVEMVLSSQVTEGE